MTPPFCLLRYSLVAPLLAAATLTQAQTDWPSKPVRIVVQFQPGGTTDTVARILAEQLGQRLGQTVLVDNRPGAGTIIATNHVAKSAPDGYSLLLTVPAAITSNLVLYKKLPYDPRTELRMVSDIVAPAMVMVVHPKVQAEDFKSLLEEIRKAPGTFAMGSWGAGTQPHQVQTFMDQSYGLQTMHIAYKGEAPMAVDLVNGILHMTVGSVATFKPFIESGKLRPLAVIGSQRSPFLPDVPTFAEQGYGDTVYTVTGSISLMAPKATPDAIVERLGRELGAIMQMPELRQRVENLGLQPIGNSPEQASAAYAAYLPVALELAKATGVTLD